jgi:hypothetical protein
MTVANIIKKAIHDTSQGVAAFGKFLHKISQQCSKGLHKQTNKQLVTAELHCRSAPTLPGKVFKTRDDHLQCCPRATG